MRVKKRLFENLQCPLGLFDPFFVDSWIVRSRTTSHWAHGSLASSRLASNEYCSACNLFFLQVTFRQMELAACKRSTWIPSESWRCSSRALDALCNPSIRPMWQNLQGKFLSAGPISNTTGHPSWCIPFSQVTQVLNHGQNHSSRTPGFSSQKLRDECFEKNTSLLVVGSPQPTPTTYWDYQQRHVYRVIHRNNKSAVCSQILQPEQLRGELTASLKKKINWNCEIHKMSPLPGISKTSPSTEATHFQRRLALFCPTIPWPQSPVSWDQEVPISVTKRSNGRSPIYRMCPIKTAQKPPWGICHGHLWLQGRKCHGNSK